MRVEDGSALELDGLPDLVAHARRDSPEDLAVDVLEIGAMPHREANLNRNLLPAVALGRLELEENPDEATPTEGRLVGIQTQSGVAVPE